MNKLALLGCLFLLSACVHEAYRLKTDSELDSVHGQSVYYRSSMRSAYAGQIRRVLSNKFGEIGIKTATSTENADYIAIFDIETFYRNSGTYKDADYATMQSDDVLFSADEDASSQHFSGNANMLTDIDKTCFTLNIGKKGTSSFIHKSTFCADRIVEPEEFLPYILDIYGKYANYKKADIGVQCLTDSADKISCEPVHDRQQAFFNSLWSNRVIAD